MQYRITNDENETVYTVETNKSDAELDKLARRLGRYNGAQVKDNAGEIWVEKASTAGAIRDMLSTATRPAATHKSRRPVEYCHYCGQPATSHDFYNAPVCDGCR